METAFPSSSVLLLSSISEQVVKEKGEPLWLTPVETTLPEDCVGRASGDRPKQQRWFHSTCRKAVVRQREIFLETATFRFSKLVLSELGGLE